MSKFLLVCCALLLSFTGTAAAHFGMIIPSANTVADNTEAVISLDFSFSHPMQMIGMPLAKPQAVRVFFDGAAEDITAGLKAARIMDHDAWKTEYKVKKPGVYQFVMEPTPYWEPAEERFIIHYTKTYVAAFGAEEGWAEPTGIKTEIVPLTRPFGNYAGNVFQGRVLLDGKPVPGAQVEIEYYNQDKKYKIPNDYMIAQSVRADADGVFTYGIPFAGWWGFAALSESDEKLPRDGAPKDVEIGAVLWTKFIDPVSGGVSK